MGLDSAYLLIRLEKEFQKELSNQDAENIETIADAINWFFKNTDIKQPDKKVQEVILSIIKESFESLNLPNSFVYEDKIKDFLPKVGAADVWISIGKKMNLKMPKLNSQGFLGSKSKGLKILGLTILRPEPSLIEMDFRRLIECMGALNYKKFVDFDNITSFFEVTIAVIGITQDECSIDVDEIFIDSLFSKDLGIY